MNKIRIFTDDDTIALEQEVNNFLIGKNITGVSISAEKIGFGIKKYVLVWYNE